MLPPIGAPVLSLTPAQADHGSRKPWLPPGWTQGKKGKQQIYISPSGDKTCSCKAEVREHLGQQLPVCDEKGVEVKEAPPKWPRWVPASFTLQKARADLNRGSVMSYVDKEGNRFWTREELRTATQFQSQPAIHVPVKEMQQASKQVERRQKQLFLTATSVAEIEMLMSADVRRQSLSTRVESVRLALDSVVDAKVLSDRSREVAYYVHVFPQPFWVCCTCPEWKARGGCCKHAGAVLRSLVSGVEEDAQWIETVGRPENPRRSRGRPRANSDTAEPKPASKRPRGRPRLLLQAGSLSHFCECG